MHVHFKKHAQQQVPQRGNQSDHRNPVLRIRGVEVLLFLLAAWMLSSCAPQPAAELDNLGTAVAGTATAAAGEPDQKQAVAEAQLTATQAAQDLQATQAAQSELDADVLTATATAFGPFLAELPLYGVDPNQGRPGWIHPPLRLQLDGFHDYDFGNEFLVTIAADFVISADITWDTQYGGSGCGFVIRSDGNKAALNQYLVIATRAASGHVLFGVMADGNLVNGRDLYAYGLDPAFDWQNGATNQLTVVGRGSQFDIYTNNTLIGSVNPNDPLPQPRLPDPPIKPADLKDVAANTRYAQELAEYETVTAKIKADFQARLNDARNAEVNFENGFMAMVALSQSGTVDCQFNNAWLWLIE